ncbi:HD domain-containing protein [Hahella sp. KA22]|uniref:HD domain-containing protein n=1 Tax=Hahella sp. KA22 TaxID=1628392 RepID=UPI000FDD6F82|nr:HD domain-containing protein [Hahella sp. KA22]AZZ93545.1 HD domain-containing protein [Hahella sp. KA22]QAY56920.1 HD domain-containing protein [Hahella sp. KA22]
MLQSDIHGILEFLRGAEQLKNVIRSAWTSAGRKESTAEHTWRLCLMAMVFEKALPELDFARLLKICLIHDLGEAISGDIPATEQSPDVDKSIEERKDLQQLLTPLPKAQQQEILALWDDYDQMQSIEAKVAKALDKMETILQHNQGKNPQDFDYAFNLEYGKKYANIDPFIQQLREIVDQETLEKAQGSGKGLAK